MACCIRKTGNDLNLKKNRFRLDVMKIYYMMRMVKHWNRFPRVVVDF